VSDSTSTSDESFEGDDLDADPEENMSEGNLDAARKAAMDEVERNERKARRFLIAAGVTEAVLFIAIVMVIDVNDTTHWLIFLCACLVYGPIAFGMVALRSYLDLSTKRVLTALQFGPGSR
jgi:hypothetical protein